VASLHAGSLLVTTGGLAKAVAGLSFGIKAVLVLSSPLPSPLFIFVTVPLEAPGEHFRRMSVPLREFLFTPQSGAHGSSRLRRFSFPSPTVSRAAEQLSRRR